MKRRRTRAFRLSAAQLRVYTAAYCASEITCSMAERTHLGQDLGSRIADAFGRRFMARLMNVLA